MPTHLSRFASILVSCAAVATGTACSDGSPLGRVTECKFAGDCTDPAPCEKQEGAECLDGDCVYPGKAEGSLCGPGESCVEQVCMSSECVVRVIADGADCQREDPCVAAAACSDGVCTAVRTLDCNDDNPCTDDSCGVGACVHTDNTALCDDGDPCSVLSECQEGTCIATAFFDCDDDNACTADSCNDGHCRHDDITGDCDDGDLCTTASECIHGECTAIAEILCDDDNGCTTDSCINGDCFFVDNSDLCNDGDNCTPSSACFEGECVATSEFTCDDENPCTDDMCNSESTGCVFTAHNRSCDDGNLCSTASVCSAGNCEATAWLNCDDDNGCTDDACVDGVCDNVDNDDLCDDGDACSLSSRCSEGGCRATIWLDCDDDNACTDDRCVSGLCENIDNRVTCDDGDACSTASQCQDGGCTAIAWMDCGDDNECTQDVCSNGVCSNPDEPSTTPCVSWNPECSPQAYCGEGACYAASGCDDAQLSAVYRHTLYLNNTGHVKCWGYNTYAGCGQDPTSLPAVPTAMEVPELSHVVSVSAGDFSSCALIGDGTVRCWGWGGFGMLGDGIDETTHIPTYVSGIHTAVALISTDGSTHCAILRDRTVWCWGQCNGGQCGTAPAPSNQYVPEQHPTVSDVLQLGGGGDAHICAIENDRTMSCWGENYWGQLGTDPAITDPGDGGINLSTVPLPVAGLANVIGLALQGVGSCALLGTGQVRCWGHGSNGELGNGNTFDTHVPQTVIREDDDKPLENVVLIASGYYNTFALLEDGTLYGWGGNLSAALGDGTTSAHRKAIPIPGLGDVGVRDMVSGVNHSCAQLLDDDTLRCWGNNSDHQMGNPAYTDSIIYTKVQPVGVP